MQQDGSLYQQFIAYSVKIFLKHCSSSAIKDAAVPHVLWMEFLQAIVATGCCFWQEPDSEPPLKFAPTLNGVPAWVEEDTTYRLTVVAGPQRAPCIDWFVPMYYDAKQNAIGSIVGIEVGAPYEALRSVGAIPKDMDTAVSNYVRSLQIENIVPLVDSKLEWHQTKPITKLSIDQEIRGQRGRNLVLEFEYRGDRCVEDGDVTHIYTIDNAWMETCFSRLKEIGFKPAAPVARGDLKHTLLPSNETCWQMLRKEIRKLREEGIVISAETAALLKPMDLTERNFVLNIGDDKPDWFGVSIAIKIGEEEINLLPILISVIRGLDDFSESSVNSLNQDGKFTSVLGDGRIISMPFDRIKLVLLSLHEFLARHASHK